MLEVGALLDGKYRILDEVGHGGMSVVYMARNEKANKTWAVKEVRKDGKMDFNTVRAGLVAEIETLKNLNHPNLPSIVDVIEDDESFIIVMDFIEGNSLDKVLDENGAQPEEFVVEWAMQLCDVFGYLHSRTPPIIYRDMKPANVMLKPDGNVTVIDFGTAKAYEIDLGQTTGIGTIGYAAPEQYRGSGFGRTDARTDIYCLGMTLYHLVTGIDPCKNIIDNKSIRAINPALSHGLDIIIQKCIQDLPDNRYQSCAELMYDLEHYKDFEPAIKKRQKRKLATFLLTALMSVVFVLTGIGLNIVASQKATDTYQKTVAEADGKADYSEKIKLYEEAINIPGQGAEEEAYLKLLALYDKDNLFEKSEVNQIDNLIKTFGTDIQEDNSDGYSQICFEIGNLYWYSFYDDNQLTRAQNSIYWFEEVIKYSDESYTDRGTAKAYISIGEFYRDIQSKVDKGKDKGMYKPLFDNLTDVIETIALNTNEADKVRLDVLELARSALHQYVTGFKRDDVTKAEVESMLGNIKTCLAGIADSTAKIEEMKQSISSLLPDTENAIQTAFATTKGGN